MLFSDLSNEQFLKFLSDILDRSDYEEMLRINQRKERLDNLAELKQAVYDYEISCGGEALLPDYLDHVALLRIVTLLMILQQSKIDDRSCCKGLEFPRIPMCINEEFSLKPLQLRNGREERRLLHLLQCHVP